MKISQYTSLSQLDATAVFPVVQSGITYKASVGSLTGAGSNVNLASVVFTTGDQTIDGVKSFNLTPTFSLGINGPVDGGGHLRWSVDNLGSTTIGRRVVGPALEFDKNGLNGYDGNLTSDFYSLYTFDHGNHHADFRIPVNVSGDVNITGKLLVSGISLTEKIVYTTGDQITSGQKLFQLVGTNIITAGFFGDDTRIDLLNKNLLDSTPGVSLDWENRQLMGNGTTSVFWNDLILSGGNWKVQGLNVSGISINPNTVLTSSNQNVSGIKRFYNQAKFLSGLNTSGNVDITGSLNVRGTLSVDSITTSSSDTDIRVDVVNRQLLDSAPVPALDWNLGQLLFNGAIMLDWSAQVLTGTWKAQGLTINGSNVVTANQTGVKQRVIYNFFFPTTTTGTALSSQYIPASITVSGINIGVETSGTSGILNCAIYQRTTGGSRSLVASVSLFSGSFHSGTLQNVIVTGNNRLSLDLTGSYTGFLGLSVGVLGREL
jgi:hypothetical protein